MADLIVSLLIFFLQQTIITDTIRIGLLVQDKQSIAAVQGAQLAISEANRLAKGARYYSLQVRDMEGPWGTGAKVSVSLVFDDDVVAVIGAVDGRNSHLAEQVSAKTGIPFISALSGDPTLAQAFIPWFFSCVPGDDATAGLIIREIEKGAGSPAIIISAEDYDSKMAASSLQKKWIPGKVKKPEVVYYSNASQESAALGKKITPAGNIVFFGPPADLATIMRLSNKPGAVIYAPYLLMHEKTPEPGKFEGVIFLDPGSFFRNDGHPFTSGILKAYGDEPGPLQAYSYDAVKILIEGITLSLNDRSSLFRNTAGINHAGVTGDISFDERGNRKTYPGLLKVEKGRLVRIGF